MTLRDRMNAVADRVRAIASKPSIDERPISVTIRTTTYAGGRVGAEGGTSIVDVVLTPTPRVREVNQREIAGSGGRYEVGDVRVSSITPAYTSDGGGGYTPAQLAPTITADGVLVTYVLAGNIAGNYQRVALHTDDPHDFILILRRQRSSP